jgi:hypothetical protein
LSVAATDNIGVASVSFLLDGQLLASDTSAPYSTSYNFKNTSIGSHILSAVATDGAGNTAVANITIWR